MSDTLRDFTLLQSAFTSFYGVCSCLLQYINACIVLFSIFVIVVQPLNRVQFFVTPWTVACQASLSFIIYQSMFKFISIESVMPYNHLILCFLLLLMPSIFHSIKIFSSELAFCIWWPKYWSFSFSISPSNEYQGWFPLGLIGLISLLSKELSRVFFSMTIQSHQLFST